MIWAHLASDLCPWLSLHQLQGLLAGQAICLDCPQAWPALEVSPGAFSGHLCTCQRLDV